MPIYEYRCNACKRTTSVFQRSIGTAVSATCEQCGSADLDRLMSKFAFRRSAGGDLGAAGFDDEALLDGVDENDPRSVARWARQMGDRMGEDMGPEFDQMLERMEAGEAPDDGEGDDGVEDFDGSF